MPGQEENRARWGCDSDAPAPVFSTPCNACGGRSAECPKCEGSGEVAHYRCPRKLADDSAFAYLEAYDWLESHGVLPVAGGYLDQTPAFLSAVQMIGPERQRIKSRDEDRGERLRALMGKARSGGERD